MTAYHYAYGAVSGFAVQDCHILVRRAEAVGDGAAETLVVRSRSGGTEGLRIVSGASSLWRSPEGPVFVGGRFGISWCEEPWRHGNAPWRHEEVPEMWRVFGLSASQVWAWDPFGHAREGLFFDGRAFTGFPIPTTTLAMHGVRLDLLVAVGRPGLIARWDGRAWTRLPTDVGGAFRDVCVVSDEEMYAVHEDGSLWEGSVHGWAVRARFEGRTLDRVVKWRDRVWVTGHRGLCVLEGAELTPVKAGFRARHLDARGDLIFTLEALLGGTSDGETFRGSRLDLVESLFAGLGPL